MPEAGLEVVIAREERAVADMTGGGRDAEAEAFAAAEAVGAFEGGTLSEASLEEGAAAGEAVGVEACLQEDGPHPGGVEADAHAEGVDRRGLAGELEDVGRLGAEELPGHHPEGLGAHHHIHSILHVANGHAVAEVEQVGEVGFGLIVDPDEADGGDGDGVGR